MLTALDHVVIGVRELDGATRRLAALLGRDPSWIGDHPGAGTANALFRLENTCIELLAPAGPGPHGEALARWLAAHGEGALGLAFATDAAAAVHEELAGRGLHPEAPGAGSGREQGSGAVRGWRHVMLRPDETRGVLLFAIERDASPELPLAPLCAEAAGSVHALDHAVLQTLDADATRRVYAEGLGLRLALDRRFEEWGVRLLFFRVGALTLEVAARIAEAPGLVEAESMSPERDRLWGLSYRVPDVAAAQKRVAMAGFEVSELRVGRRPGTRVCTVRGEPLGVATLLIGPDLGA